MNVHRVAMPNPHPADVRAYFARRAATYRQAAERGLWAWQRRREAAAILGVAGALHGRAALDLGCGAGFYARLLADRGARPVVAVDAVPDMIAELGDPRIQGVVADIATLPLGRPFDLVLLAGVLEFVPDAAQVLASARRHLAQGGSVVVLLPPDSPAGRLYRWFHRRHGLEIALFTADRLHAAADSARLAVAVTRRVPPYGVVYGLTAR